MPFIPPMLASPLPKNFILSPGVYAAEEKFDGHRIVCEVQDGATNLFTEKRVTAWSRHGLVRPLPTHLLEALCKMPSGIYDGELLVPGKRSYGVTELANTADLTYFIFDIIALGQTDATFGSYNERRAVLAEIEGKNLMNNAVRRAPSYDVNTWEEVTSIRDAVWARDGEGLILKRRNAPYQIGKRSKDFIKIKDLRSAVLTVIGFQPSRGLINDRGPYATVIIRDDDGNVTTVKTRNDAACAAFEKEAPRDGSVHPAIGRKLRIEFQERTPDGNYRHPRWDRWEDA